MPTGHMMGSSMPTVSNKDDTSHSSQAYSDAGDLHMS